MTASEMSDPGRFTSTKEQLVVAAERLFSIYGFDGVSLQQIRAAAGQANRSAVQYHFGSKEGLVQAIFEYRLPAINRRRVALLDGIEAAGEGGVVRRILEALFVPLAEEAEYGEGSYVSFLRQLGYYGWAKEEYRKAGGDLTRPAFRCLALLRDALSMVPEPLRDQRVAGMLVALPSVLAEREHTVRAGAARILLPFSLFVSDLLDSISEALMAPVSDTTRNLLANCKPGELPSGDWVYDSGTAAPAGQRWRGSVGDSPGQGRM